MTIETLSARRMLASDLLYVGDNATNSIEVFDSDSGAHIKTLVSGSSGKFIGPRGLVIQGADLLAVNQNTNTPFNGEVLRFDKTSGSARPKLVSSSNANAPFAPRGLVVQNNVAYVADAESTPTRIARYNATTGAFLGNLVPSGFTEPFHPRGLVFGPDGGLYVTSFNPATFFGPDPAGYVLRIDVSNGGFRVVARNDGDSVVETGETNLHNPEGIAFGPNGRLYVTSNRVSPTTGIDENTNIVVIDPVAAREVDRIALTPVTRPDNPTRIFSQALLFGPAGKLYTPIRELSLNDGLSSGGVWTVDPATRRINALVVPSLFDPPLSDPYYLSFGNTDPATLAYKPVLPASWTNPRDRFNVDDKGGVTSLDALQIINELGRQRVFNPVDSKLFPITSSVGPPPFYDVNRDGKITSLDALQVINQIARNGLASSQQPEFLSNPANALESDVTTTWSVDGEETQRRAAFEADSVMDEIIVLVAKGRVPPTTLQLSDIEFAMAESIDDRITATMKDRLDQWITILAEDQHSDALAQVVAA